jgi:hypothetical protein
MGSEYATGEGASFITPGAEPSKIGGAGLPGESSGGKSKGMGMAKALIEGVREYVSETVEIFRGGGRRVTLVGGGKKSF